MTAPQQPGERHRETATESDGAFVRRHGGIVDIGPECFGVVDGALICWRGRNYVPQPDPDAEAEGAARYEALPAGGFKLADEIEQLGHTFGINAAGCFADGDGEGFDFHESVSNTLRGFADRLRALLGADGDTGSGT